MKVEIGISEKNIERSISLLSSLLSDEMTLYVKTRKFHWNVVGDNFMELHKLFQNQYIELEQSIDFVAERIRKLGGKTLGTMDEFIKLTKIKESPNTFPNQKNMLFELLKDHELIISDIRIDIIECDKNDDFGTADLLTGLMEEHETSAWNLRSYFS